MHLGDDRLRQARQGEHHAAALQEQGLDLLQGAHRLDLTQVMARAKAASIGSNDHHPRAGVERDPLEFLLEARDEPRREGVEMLGPVERQGHDTLLLFTQEHWLHCDVMRLHHASLC